MLNEILDGVEIGEKSALDISRVFPDDSDYKATILDIADVKSQIKLHNATETSKKVKRKTTCNYIIDGHYYNAGYLVEVFEILGGSIT